jgi:selenocysteine lyase/cysteine desulfurase
VKALDVDFFVTGTLKYLLGPPGLAFLYVRRELIQPLTPTITSWMAQRDVFAFNTQSLDPAAAARRFENGTPAIPNIYMASPALKLLRSAGMDHVAAQIERLTRAFLHGVRDLGIAAKTPASSIGPLVVLRASQVNAAQEIVARMAAQGIVVSARRDGVRFAFHIYNTLDDVQTALSALEDNRELMVRT